MAASFALLVLSALAAFANAQEATTSAPDAAATVAPTDSSLPNCVPLCMQVKFAEQDTLAPNCNVNDLFCLCTTTKFVTAYRQCLFDNCGSTTESTAGRQTLAEICADSGASLLSYSALHNQQAAQSAVQEVDQVLNMPVSGVADQPSASFDPNMALSYVASNYAQQGAYATSAAAQSLSQVAMQASASLQQEAVAISASLQAAVMQASQIDRSLETQLSGSALSAAQAQVTATLSMMRVAASAKLQSAIDNVQASLAAESGAVFSTTTSVAPSAAVNARSSAGLKLEVSTMMMASLFGIAIAAFALL